VSSPAMGNIIGVVGWKDTGKTTFVESLVRLLKAKGYSVGTVKHVRGGASLEPETTDSMRHLGAGAALTVAAGQDLTVVLDRSGDDLGRVVTRYLWSCDYVVVEGFKGSGIPKIAVIADGEDIPEVGNIVAVVYRNQAPQGYRTFGFDETEKLLDYLFENEIIKQPSRRTVLFVNGNPVPLNDFVQTSLANVIRGFLASLKDVDPPSTISLHIRS
jgi:molybdopterin-guanine dinucleotide biosynthesis protein MobB